MIHYLGLKSNNKPELSGAEFTEDVEYNGNYALELQNINNLQNKESYWLDNINDTITINGIIFGTSNFSVLFNYITNKALSRSGLIGGSSSCFGLALNSSDQWASTLVNISDNPATLNIITPNVYETITYARDYSTTTGTYFLNGKIDSSIIDAFDYSGSITIIGSRVNYTSFWSGGISKTLIFNISLDNNDSIDKAIINGGSIPYKYKGSSQTLLTSGTLLLGKHYTIDTYVSGDDFTNISGTNNSGTSFVATGTTPTVWTNGSSLRQTGCVLELLPSGIGHNQWLDSSGNNNHGTVDGAIPVNLPTNHIEKVILKDISTNQTFILPAGYKVNSTVIEETSGNDITGNFNIGIGALGVEIVNREPVTTSATVDCTIIQAEALQSLSSDTEITISSSDWGSSVNDIYIIMERLIA